MQKIQKWSRFIRIFFQMVFIAIPLITFVSWGLYDLHVDRIIDLIQNLHASLPIKEGILYSTRFLCFMISMIPNGIIMFGFYHLIKLFKLYEVGHVFTSENIRHIKICAYTILVWVFADFLTHTLLTLALTIDNPQGQKILAVSVEYRHFSTLIVSLVAIIIAQVMDEARKLKDENDYIV